MPGQNRMGLKQQSRMLHVDPCQRYETDHPEHQDQHRQNMTRPLRFLRNGSLPWTDLTVPEFHQQQ